MNYIIIKCGGSVLEELPLTFYQDVVNLQKSRKWKPIIVHGGGPFISSLLHKLQIETKFHDGMRITSPEVLDVVEMVLTGSVNKNIVSQLKKAGGRALGISGADGDLLNAKIMDNGNLGLVGEVHQVNTELVSQIMFTDNIPVISPIGIDERGNRLNINGDLAAAAVAKALGGKLCFVSDISGVYSEENGKKIWKRTLNKKEAEQLINKKIIKGGMVPKVRSALDTLSAGVKEVVILDGKEKSSLSNFCAGMEVGTKMVQ
ncbi:acetylglutamate kinase [Salirhabdus euzebyi]|uniref:Acetylglutamate kinase n=1 Tax=Salirhabdus euzebyi TaxID=394506 RepID=A0A841Q5S6_9BACI|nr:acetylglutamate kinase [Salirhabdus euzebyi]MBB6453760.1 acetylglutamate kinase [Salirhabdus euzebyi]